VRFLVNNNWAPAPYIFVSVAAKRLRVPVSGLESTVTGIPPNVDSKGI
jgi:hypothetical protein